MRDPKWLVCFWFPLSFKQAKKRYQLQHKTHPSSAFPVGFPLNRAEKDEPPMGQGFGPLNNERILILGLSTCPILLRMTFVPPNFKWTPSLHVPAPKTPTVATFWSTILVVDLNVHHPLVGGRFQTGCVFSCSFFAREHILCKCSTRFRGSPCLPGPHGACGSAGKRPRQSARGRPADGPHGFGG